MHSGVEAAPSGGVPMISREDTARVLGIKTRNSMPGADEATDEDFRHRPPFASLLGGAQASKTLGMHSVEFGRRCGGGLDALVWQRRSRMRSS